MNKKIVKGKKLAVEKLNLRGEPRGKSRKELLVSTIENMFSTHFCISMHEGCSVKKCGGSIALKKITGLDINTK